ncbi:uncharacterized protein LOC121404097 [Drosophila obscura]|nr:uncharacterized protein LOC121404097 [Drosophila obscura]
MLTLNKEDTISCGSDTEDEEKGDDNDEEKTLNVELADEGMDVEATALYTGVYAYMLDLILLGIRTDRKTIMIAAIWSPGVNCMAERHMTRPIFLRMGPSSPCR